MTDHYRYYCVRFRPRVTIIHIEEFTAAVASLRGYRVGDVLWDGVRYRAYYAVDYRKVRRILEAYGDWTTEFNEMQRLT